MSNSDTKKSRIHANDAKYIEARGARKTSVARVRLISGGKPGIIVNNKDYKQYFKTDVQRAAVEAPLAVVGGFKELPKQTITVRVSGGGLTGQSEAIRHGLARVLVKLKEEWRKQLKQPGFLKRDPRMVERKKYGLKKARRAPQWAKR